MPSLASLLAQLDQNYIDPYPNGANPNAVSMLPGVENDPYWDGPVSSNDPNAKAKNLAMSNLTGPATKSAQGSYWQLADGRYFVPEVAVPGSDSFDTYVFESPDGKSGYKAYGQNGTVGTFDNTAGLLTGFGKAGPSEYSTGGSFSSLLNEVKDPSYWGQVQGTYYDAAPEERAFKVPGDESFMSAVMGGTNDEASAFGGKPWWGFSPAAAIAGIAGIAAGAAGGLGSIGAETTGVDSLGVNPNIDIDLYGGGELPGSYDADIPVGSGGEVTPNPSTVTPGVLEGLLDNPLVKLGTAGAGLATGGGGGGDDVIENVGNITGGGGGVDLTDIIEETGNITGGGTVNNDIIEEMGNFTGELGDIAKTPEGSNWLKGALDALKAATGLTGKDLLNLAGKLGAAGLQAFASNQQSTALADLAKRYEGYGAPSRARYEAGMTPGFDPNNIAGYSGALDSASQSIMRKLSASGGNPWGNPGGLIEANKAIVSGTAMPAINEYLRLNANTGFGSSMNAASGLERDSISANTGVLAGLASGLGSLTAPDNSLAALLERYPQLFRLNTPDSSYIT